MGLLSKSAVGSRLRRGNYEFCQGDTPQTGGLNDAAFYPRRYPEIDAGGGGGAVPPVPPP